ncbi:redoxin domain-containing protein [Rugamonas sp. FT82W]|uniref:Redoxin domain-containing protein n=1 Tax=Duganella vulcania TaxID=2692166 RepID=A0A845GC40_9BURK|nr:redoxin domain-containing protein [Duganella vulcania]MYM91864.1 redoxin domain-containing protein [Duganella vulcania]
MDSQILYLTLALLALGLALNIKLTLSVLHTTRRERDTPEALSPGAPVPQVQARALRGGAVHRMGAGGQAAALLFLSSKCPKCKTKLAEIGGMLAPAEQAGLDIWIVSHEPGWRLRQFLRGFPLTRALRVTLRDYKLLNPTLASPSYMMVNHEGVLEAAGMIGDDDWLNLCAQLADGVAEDAEAAAEGAP